MNNKRKRRLGDRKEGRKLRTLDPIKRAMPYIMPKRSDSQNFFTEKLDIAEAEKFCREQIKAGRKNFSLLHVIIAAYIRVVSQRPAINRFVSGQTIYARNNIEVLMTIKKKMTLESEDACIKVVFEPTDTVYDVYDKFNKIVEENKDAASCSLQRSNFVIASCNSLVVTLISSAILLPPVFRTQSISVC